MKIIDSHVHIYEYLAGYAGMGEFRALGGGKARWMHTSQADSILPGEFGDTGVTAERMLAFMDAHDIEKAVLLQGAAYGFQNEYFMETQKKYPDRFLATAAIDPFFYFFDQILDRQLNEMGFLNYKFEFSQFGGMCGYHDADMLWKHPNLKKVIKELDQRGGTVAFDIGLPGLPCHRVDILKELIESAPNAHFVICHLLCMTPDSEETLKREMELLHYPNVWYDLAAVPTNTQEHGAFFWARKYLKTAKDIVGAERLLWGTDMPTVLNDQPYNDYTFEELVSVEKDADIFTQEELQGIFHDNSLKAYRHS